MGAVLAVAIFITLALLYFPYTIDDAYISLRYARNAAAGLGFVFDEAVPPVEGYTNFLWILCEVPFFAFGLPGEVLTYVKVLGIVWGLGTVAAAFLLGRAAYGGGGGGLAALFVAVTGNFAFWAVAGLETAQYLCLALGATYLSLRVDRGVVVAVAAGLAWALAAAARPEGCALAAAVLAYGLIAGGPGRARYLLAAAAFGVVYGAYFWWRAEYFEALLPNTYYARGGFFWPALAARLRGLAPFAAYVAPAVVLAAVLGWRRRNRDAGFIWVAAAASLALAFAARREWMPGFRYELPFVAFLWVAAGGAFDWLRRRLFGLPAAVALAVTLAYLFLPGVPLYGERPYTEGLNRAHVALGRWLREAAPPGSSLAAWDMGALPYYSEFPRIYDINPEGLLARETTRDGYRPEYFLAEEPTFFVLYSSRADGLQAPPGHWTWSYYRAPGFASLYRYLFTFTMREGYNLRVYLRRDVSLSAAAVAAGEVQARDSRAGENSFAGTVLRER
ncbi:MAG: hypothetical protein JSU81_08205 [Candidatus Coatesbacteria bacterium]|nr:MAG: hypothetical protein JSU81_08205 [Candidatus Coatesbacteria bacterium]